MKLYELDEAIDRFWYTIESQEGEISPEQERELDALQKDWSAKMLNSAIALKRFAAERKALQEQQRILGRQMAQLDHRIEWLEGYVGRSLRHERTFKDPSGAHRLYWKPSERVEPVDPENFLGVPEEWLERKEVVRLMKAEIKEYVKKYGEEIEGVQIETYWNLQVK
jgi:hypothetical protein